MCSLLSLRTAAVHPLTASTGKRAPRCEGACTTATVEGHRPERRMSRPACISSCRVQRRPRERTRD
jgi:hypothetical protein